jgi:hypothetical protein
MKRSWKFKISFARSAWTRWVWLLKTRAQVMMRRSYLSRLQLPWSKVSSMNLRNMAWAIYANIAVSSVENFLKESSFKTWNPILLTRLLHEQLKFTPIPIWPLGSLKRSLVSNSFFHLCALSFVAMTRRRFNLTISIIISYCVTSKLNQMRSFRCRKNKLCPVLEWNYSIKRTN